jgi:hypothetical protein
MSFINKKKTLICLASFSYLFFSTNSWGYFSGYIYVYIYKERERKKIESIYESRKIDFFLD